MRRFPLALLLLLAPAAAGATVERVPQLDVEVRPFGAPAEMQSVNLSVAEHEPREARFGWDLAPGRPVQVTLRATAAETDDEETMVLGLTATLVLPDGRQVQASREDRVQSRETILFELFRLDDDRPVTLALNATVGHTWRARRAPRVGRAVRFDLEIVYVDGEREVAVERNVLNTFEQQSVRYELRSELETDPSLTLRLTPVRLVGDLVEIRVQLSGRLPARDDEPPSLVARDENLIVNRGSMSPVDLVSGDPPVGYRFRITPRF